MKQIIFRERDWQELESYLTKRNDVESGTYAVFKTSVSNSTIKLLVNHVIIPENRDYFKRSPASVAFTPDFTERAFQQCETTRGHLLDIHTHPWSTDVNFSSVDNREAEYTKVPYMRKYLPEIIIAFIVFGESPAIVRARFWDKTQNRLSEIDRIVVI